MKSGDNNQTRTKGACVTTLVAEADQLGYTYLAINDHFDPPP